jgi:hypothetical protein
MKSLESFSENVIGFRMVHAIIGHRVYPCDLFLFIIIECSRSVHSIVFMDTKVGKHG